MASYQQMGHHSENLLTVQELDQFKGAILSPVNYPIEEISEQVAQHQERLELIFDPQLYYPRSERGCLPDWSYFPEEFDSADLSSLSWWAEVNSKLVDTMKDIGANAVCSPASVPREFDSDYYSVIVQVGNSLGQMCSKIGVETLQTIMINFPTMASVSKVFEVSSIASQTTAERVFLVFITDQEPRRELEDTEALKGAMRLVRELESAGLKVLVGFCSSDVLLWKAAGASSCASGKFFNLRRFTKGRFEEPQGGGGQLPYWIEESNLAFLRESDIIRVRQEGMLSESTQNNPFSQSILSVIEKGEPWLGSSWRHYLYWFADVEQRLDKNPKVAQEILRQADKNWEYLEDNNVFMEERRNDGRWIRPWRRALVEYPKI